MSLLTAGSQIFSSRLLQVAANAVVVLLVADRLGPAGQGHYSLTLAVVMIAAAVLNGGVGLAAVPDLRQSRVALPRMLRAQAVWVAGVAVLLVLAPLVLRGTSLAALASERLGWTGNIAAAVGAAVLALVVFDIVNYDLLAIGRLVVGAGVNLARALTHLLILAALAVLVGLKLGVAVTAFAAAQVLAAVALVVLLKRSRVVDDAAVVRSPPIGLLDLVGRNLRRGWVGQVSVVAYLLMLRLDQGLVEYYHGAAVVGVYSLAVWAGELLWLIPGALTPLLVHSSAAGTDEPGRDLTAARAVRIGLLATLAAAIPVAIVAPIVFNYLSGGVYAGASYALWALLPGIVAVAPATVLAGDFIGRGHPAWNAQASILVVIVGVILGLWLIPAHGAVGAACASSLSYTLGTVLMVVRFRKVTGLPLREIFIPSWTDLRH
jgi:O-antigen/teichoic acid export membrane protein